MTMENFSSLLKYELLSVGDTRITTSNILFFFIVALLTLMVIQANRRIFTRVQATAENPASVYVLQRFSHYIVVGLGAFLCLSVLGIDMTHLALLATALSVGLGFGLQSIFSNFFSGIIVLLERSLKVGDFIELDNGVSGTVQEINIRSTLVRTRNNIDILVPNSEFVNGRVTNWTLGDPTFRLQIPFGVAYGTDKEQVRKAVMEAAYRLPFTLDLPEKKPDLWLVNFGENSLDFELVVWVDPKKNTSPGGMRPAYLWEIETSFREHGIEIPFPQREVLIKNASELKS